MLCHSHLTNIRGYELSLKVGKEGSIGASEKLSDAPTDDNVSEDIIGHFGPTDMEGENSIPLQLISQRGQEVKEASQVRSTVLESHYIYIGRNSPPFFYCSAFS